MKQKLLAGSLLLIIVFIGLVGPALAAGGVEIKLTPDKNELAVGDPVQLTLEVTHPTGYQVIIPKLDPQWDNFEVRNQSQATTTTNPDGTETTRQTIDVTLFNLGDFKTPALPLTISDGAGKVTQETAPAVSLMVKPLRAEKDTDLRDIRPQAELAIPPVWPWVLLGVAVAALVLGGGWWLYRRWRQRGGLRPVVDNRLPDQVAYDELGRIAGLNLPARGLFKEHYSLVTDCLRTYLEQQFSLHAFDRTTAELRVELKQSIMAPEPVRRLIDLFGDSDLVKFAKVTPPVAEAQQLLDEARALVTVTAPTPEPPKPEKSNKSIDQNQNQPRKPAEVTA